MTNWNKRTRYSTSTFDWSIEQRPHTAQYFRYELKVQVSLLNDWGSVANITLISNVYHKTFMNWFWTATRCNGDSARSMTSCITLIVVIWQHQRHAVNSCSDISCKLRAIKLYTVTPCMLKTRLQNLTFDCSILNKEQRIGLVELLFGKYIIQRSSMISWRAEHSSWQISQWVSLVLTDVTQRAPQLSMRHSTLTFWWPLII